MLPEILGVPYFQTTQIICWDGVEPTKLGDLMWEPSTFWQIDRTCGLFMPEILQVYLTAVSGLIDLHLPEWLWGIFAGNQNLLELMEQNMFFVWSVDVPFDKCSEHWAIGWCQGTCSGNWQVLRTKTPPEQLTTALPSGQYSLLLSWFIAGCVPNNAQLLDWYRRRLSMHLIMHCWLYLLKTIYCTHHTYLPITSS